MLLQQTTLVHVGGLLRDEKVFDTAPFKFPLNRNDALRYVTYLMLERVRLLILNCNLYHEGDE